MPACVKYDQTISDEKSLVSSSSSSRIWLKVSISIRVVLLAWRTRNTHGSRGGAEAEAGMGRDTKRDCRDYKDEGWAHNNAKGHSEIIEVAETG